ncbi:PAQR family membrane homeostasis protein TrhA [Vaginisenegalia massiliensis]|uniref:PAQR family membrane homeostasis protein TrhA n=1 Tax=Vaginisenegalia massiliensis TaxID=2058294 RepID=UPI000F548C05|nr:hemolysin III family protein [Vaginisenegalia massiliensis]
MNNHILVAKQKKIEKYNAFSHALGAFLSLGALFLLLNKASKTHSLISTWAYLVYTLSLFAMFFNSALYHSLAFSKYKTLFRKFDHAAIYVLIAGTYTPYLLIGLADSYAHLALAIIWFLAIVGMIFEILVVGKWPKVSLALYLSLGWFCVVIFFPLWQKIAWPGLVWLASGGLTYSLGTHFYRQKYKDWAHFIWHIFVFFGALFMFISIYYYL